MKPVRCENGHYYDSDKYISCPHCENRLLLSSKREEVLSDDSIMNSMERDSLLLEREFHEVRMSSSASPPGDQEEAWSWMKEKILYFQRHNLEREKIVQLECNILFYLTAVYSRHFEEYLMLSGDMLVLTRFCELSYERNAADKALEIAAPCLKYLEQHPEKYQGGQVCFQNYFEELLYRQDYDLTIRRAEDNYTRFILAFIRCLDGTLCHTMEEMEKRSQVKRYWLEVAALLSPCNAEIWIELADLYSSEEGKYQDTIRKAFRYSYHDEGPGGRYKVYEKLAMHMMDSDTQLANALCTYAKLCGGNPVAAQFILSKRGVAPMNAETSYTMLKHAGIQTGYSDLVQKTKKICELEEM